MTKSSGLKNAPSTTGNKSGGGRANAAPKTNSTAPKTSAPKRK